MDFSQIIPVLPYVFAGLFVLTLLVSLLFAAIRGLSKARIRVIIMAGCLLLAFLLTWAFKGGVTTAYPTVENALQQALTSNEAKEAYEMISGSPAVQETLLGFASALVAPILFITIFAALRIISWIVYFIVMMCVGKKLKEKDQKSKMRGLRVVGLGVLQALIIFFVLMTPFYAYLNIAAPAMEAVAAQETQTTENVSQSEHSEGVALIQQDQASVLARGNLVRFTLNDQNGQIDAKAINQLLNSVQSNFFFSMYGKLGGDLTCNFLTGFTAGGEKTTIPQEMKAIGSLVAEAAKLKDVKGIESFDESTATVLGNLVSGIGNSKVLQTIVGEMIYGITDNWKNGKTVFGAEKPDLDPVVAPLFDAILDDFHKDSRDSKQLSEDLKTLGGMITVMARSDLFKDIAGENADSDRLIETLAQGSVIKDMINALGGNTTMKNLIPELANVGMRAIGESILHLPANADEIFDKYIIDITNAVNELLASNLTYEEKVSELAGMMQRALDRSGLEVELDETVAKLYADAILSDIRDAGLTQITTDDVRAFFEICASVYEENQQNGQDSTGLLAARFGSSEKNYHGSLYGGKSKEEIMGSAVAKLASVTQEIAKASAEAESEEDFQNQLAQIQLDVSIDLSGLSKNSFTQESLKTVSAIKEGTFPTVLVTLDVFLIDTQKVNDQLNADSIGNEAEKISKIFSTAIKIKDSLNDTSEEFTAEKLSDIATDLGTILESIDSTETFEGKTSLMITAVFQKEEVANGLNVDIRTATELAKAATETVNGVETDYTATMESVSTGALIASKLSDPEGVITEDDVEDLLRTITPQTANMLKVYMTEERVIGFGIADKAASAAARLLKALFEEMADKEKYPDYTTETGAMLKMFEIARAASQNSLSESGSIFTHGSDQGKLGMTAMETVETVMDSHMVRNAIVAAIYLDGEIDPEMVNPFGLTIPTGERDYLECEAAIEEYYTSHTETRTFLKALAALFGVEAAFLN